MMAADPEQTQEQEAATGWRSALLVYLKGLAMGLGDSVPGISGGTIAVITNIYERLIYAIRAVDLDALKLAGTGQFAAAWRHIQGNFLLLVALGILSGLLISANTVLFLLENYFEALMAFFIGLVLASTHLLREHFSFKGWRAGLLLLAGLLLTAGVGLLDARQSQAGLLYLFVSGTLGICAMILPGLSGAFILLLLGVYQTVLQALLAVDPLVIAVFGAGCVTGLLIFSRLLAWLLRHFHDLAYSFIMGMLLGSIGLLWPWQQVLLQTTDSSGEVQALKTAPVWPLNYTEVTGQDPALGLCLAALLLGLSVVLLLHWLFHRSKNSDA